VDLDLHIHSTASDGFLPPEEVVLAAVEARLDLISLTDHDTVAGISAAIEAARPHPIQVIPGIEMSTGSEVAELHILGYFIDPTDPTLLAHTARASGARRERMEDILSRLRAQGVELSFEAVEAQAKDGGVLGRPHLAQAMVGAGIVSTVDDAFIQYIGNASPAYVPLRLVDPPAAIRIIRNAGGIAVWAHPPIRYFHDLLPGLVEAGLAGVEVYRPRMVPDRLLKLERGARNAGLLLSGGSDWHGPGGGPLGEFRVRSSEVAALLEAGGI
jgi:predicted metal-dependent phosphoesterase TrpH